MDDEAYITVEGLSRTYHRPGSDLGALVDVSFTVPRGQLVGIMGHSGAGKSTLLNIIGGLDRPSSGAVSVGGVDLAALDEEALAIYRRNSVGFVFQDAKLVPALTVFENVMLPLVPIPGSDEEKSAKVEAALAETNIGHRASHLPGELSGGEQQRAAVARAIVNDPELLLADEPTGELDRHNADRILELLVRLNREGRTVLVASHDESTIAVADRVLCLEEGRLTSERLVDTKGAAPEGE